MELIRFVLDVDRHLETSLGSERQVLFTTTQRCRGFFLAVFVFLTRIGKGKVVIFLHTRFNERLEGRFVTFIICHMHLILYSGRIKERGKGYIAKSILMHYIPYFRNILMNLLLIITDKKEG